MNMNFSNSKPLKVAVAFLGVMSVVLIVGAAMSRWQHAREESANLTKTIMPNGVPFPPPSPSPLSPPPVPDSESQNVFAEPEGMHLRDFPVVNLPSFTVKWLTKPKMLSLSSAQGQYIKMGDTSFGGEVIYRVGSEGMGGQTLGRWIKTSNGDFVLLEKQSHFSEEEAFFDEVAREMGRLVRDEQSEIPGVSIPNSFEYSGMVWKRKSWPRDVTPLDAILEEPSNNLASLSFGDLFSKEKKNETYTNLGSVNYFVRISDGLYLDYVLSDGRADDGTLVATWKPGNEFFSKRSFESGIKNGGCGSMGDNRYYPGKKEVEKYEKVGDLKTGGALYRMIGTNNPVFEYLYKDVQYSSKPETSREEFAKHVTILLSPDPLGRGYLFYSSLDDPSLGSMAECAKPVIYLYPEKTTDVSVKVGAHITKSEPEYGSGWKVTAEPNGTLRDGNGSAWKSLFWDGTGFGEYPVIREGRVVPRDDIREALENDLRVLGLNDRERGDFLEFWLPHMPTTPYIRLTWITTEDMNRLAPLAVSPRPDTVIRIFLDFAGQESPETDLYPQSLTSSPREGFTVIEWGGLLHTSSRP